MKLKFYAGEKAMEIIRDEGLKKERILALAGAAGGPKWLILYGIDRVLPSWLKGGSSPRFLIGSSIGAWRLSAWCHRDPIRAVDHFHSVYLSQVYSPKPSPGEIHNETVRIMAEYLDDTGMREILSNRHYRLAVLAVACSGMIISPARWKVKLGMAGAFILNILGRGFLLSRYRQTMFYDPRDNSPFFNHHRIVDRVPLTEENLFDVLKASGTIPLVNPPASIRNLDDRLFLDGGILDYHMNVPYDEGSHIILFPHYTGTVIPGWFDKMKPWTGAQKDLLKNTVMISPSEDFVKKLSMGKIPGRDDLKIFRGNNGERRTYWKEVSSASISLGEELIETIESGRIKKVVQPIP